MPQITVARTTYESPIGLIEIRSSQKGILNVRFVEQAHQDSVDDPSFHDIFDQFDAYFDRELHDFHSLSLAIRGTDFHRAVWHEVMRIPYGYTRTYGEVAYTLGKPTAARAVGHVVASNPLGLLIPCHRVVPALGGAGEYAWGAWRKEWLLRHEGRERAASPRADLVLSEQHLS